MALEITKTVVIQAAPSRVWDFLVDPSSVARCMPGAAITGRLDDKTYGGTITIKVGPVSSSYRGRVVFERLDPEAHTAEIVAAGQDVRGKGGAELRLTSRLREVAPGQTEVTATSQVNVTGLLAQMGRGMVEDVSDQMFQIFSQRMREELEAGAAGTAAAPSPPRTAAEVGAVASEPSAAGIPVAVPPSARPEAEPEALDLGSLGAKVAGRAAARALRAPTPLWLALLLALALTVLLFRR